MERLKFDAISCTQNNYTFYYTSIPKEVLVPLCYIVRRREDRKTGFQRFLNKSRARAIAKYLDANKGSIPAPIILSAQEITELEFDKGKIYFKPDESAFLVLDGQHRLFGYGESDYNYNIPVVIYSGLSLPQEVSLFIDINTNQKGVPSALLLDIKQIAGTETTTEERQRQVFDKLNNSSPLAGFLSPDKSVRGKISRSTFNNSTKVIFENGPFKDKSVDILYKGIRNFLAATEISLKNSNSEGARLNKSLIFRAIFQIFNEVITKTLTEYGNVKSESISRVIEPITIIKYEDYTGSSNATVNKLAAEMRAEINKFTEIDEDMF